MSDPSTLPGGALSPPPQQNKAQLLVLIDTHCHVHVKPEEDQRQNRHQATTSTPVSCACASADIPPSHAIVSSDRKIPDQDMDTDDRRRSDTRSPSLPISEEQQQKCEEDGISVMHITMGIREDDWVGAIAYANTTSSREGGGCGGSDNDDCCGSGGSGGSDVSVHHNQEQPEKGIKTKQMEEQETNNAHAPPGALPLLVFDATEEASVMDTRIGFRFGIGLHPWYVVSSIK